MRQQERRKQPSKRGRRAVPKSEVPRDPIELIRMVLQESGIETIPLKELERRFPNGGVLVITVEKVDLEEEIREGCRRHGLPIPDDFVHSDPSD